MKIFLMLGLLAGSAFASDDHEAEGGARTGPTKAVLEASAERGLKLSDKAVKRLGLKTTRLGADMRVPAGAVLYFKEESGVYVSRGGWYKLVEVEVAAKTKDAVTVEARSLKAGELVVTSGASRLRVAELDVLGDEEVGHGH